MSYALRIEVADVVRAFAKAPVAITRAADEGLGQGAQLVARDAQRQLAQKRVSGNLMGRIRAEPQSVLRWHVDSDAQDGGRPYAVFVERGVAAGRHRQLPDSGLAAIASWIKARGIVSRQPLRPGVDAAAQLPWLIGRLIARRGQSATPYMATALDNQRQAVGEQVAAGIRRGLVEAGLRTST